jgi:hypothetical protein
VKLPNNGGYFVPSMMHSGILDKKDFSDSQIMNHVQLGFPDGFRHYGREFNFSGLPFGFVDIISWLVVRVLHFPSTELDGEFTKQDDYLLRSRGFMVRIRNLYEEGKVIIDVFEDLNSSQAEFFCYLCFHLLKH